MIKKSPLIDSASILVIRDNMKTGALEILMVKRHKDIAFAGGAYVFPGGKVDEDDLLFDHKDTTFPVGYSELIYTAFREVFEESGLIIGSSEGAIDYRQALLDGELTFANFIKKANVNFSFENIVPFARWITPKIYPKRFDTRFFLACAPQGQDAFPDYSEIVEVKWVEPLEFIGEFKEELMFPTLMNLKLLGEASTVQQAMSHAEARKIITVEPKIVDGLRVIDPASGYGEVDQNNIHSGIKTDDK